MTLAPAHPGAPRQVPCPAVRMNEEKIMAGPTYAEAGVDYRKIEPFKRAMIDVARRTVHLPQRVPMGFHGNWGPTA